MALDVGSRLAHYDVTALIGEGGMGQVYQATQAEPPGNGKNRQGTLVNPLGSARPAEARSFIVHHRHLITPLISVFPLVVGLAVSAQIQIDPGQQHLLLRTGQSSTMQTELNEAVALGFRIVTGSPSNEEITILLRREPEPVDPCEYLLLAASVEATLQNELNEAASQGYRLLPRTVSLYGAGGWFASNEIVAVVERGTVPVLPQREYRVLSTKRLSTLEDEIAQAAESGFLVVAFVLGAGHIAIIEREASS